MDHHFHPSIKVEQELYGQAILSIHNAQLIKADLITSEKRIWEEPRAAVMTKMLFKDTTFYLLNTHLGLTGPEKLSQTQKLLSSEWLGAVSQNPCIICGDFNSGPRSKVYKLITEHFEDAQKKLKSHNPKKTWMGHLPVKRLDHIFLSSHFTPVDVIIPRNRQTVLASDHLPLIVDLKLNSSYTTS
jgi:endonuclease/exonuclease/phosphatase family metal-dependent hydrolase